MNSDISRREFLKGAAVTGAAVATAGTFGLNAMAATDRQPKKRKRKNSMKTIVISDIHIGIDDSFAETVKNRPLLIDFLHRIKRQKDVDEVVIAGDFLDGWMIPSNYSIPATSDEFYKAVAANNSDVIDAFKALIDAGIRVVYTPGNHDMTTPYGTLAQILPGIAQARDARGLGRYRTGVRGEIVIEHSHRYEILMAPDPISNQSLMDYGEAILPIGYFMARYERLAFTEGTGNLSNVSLDADKLFSVPSSSGMPVIKKPAISDADQEAAFAYYKILDLTFSQIHVHEGVKEPIFKIAVDGFKGNYSISDLIPVLNNNNEIAAKLFPHIQRHWEEIQRRNYVSVPNDALESMKRAADQEYRIQQAKRQYFDLDETIDVVVFGHTHRPAYREFSGYGRKKIFANSGTWLDHNSDDPANTATFVEIKSTQSGDTVAVKKCVGESKVENIVTVHNDYTKYA